MAAYQPVALQGEGSSPFVSAEHRFSAKLASVGVLNGSSAACKAAICGFDSHRRLSPAGRWHWGCVRKEDGRKGVNKHYPGSMVQRSAHQAFNLVTGVQVSLLLPRGLSVIGSAPALQAGGGGSNPPGSTRRVI
jgi:hypothetical protein